MNIQIKNKLASIAICLSAVTLSGCDTSGVDPTKFQILSFNGHSYIAYDGNNYDSGLLHNPDCLGSHDKINMQIKNKLASVADKIEKLAILIEEADNVQQDFNDAINFAIEDDDPRAFLETWREGDWDTLRSEWPEFKLPSIANKQ